MDEKPIRHVSVFIEDNMSHSHADPMVHRGIGDAAKGGYTVTADAPEVNFPTLVEVVARIDKATKRKARSDRMKATWAKQRGEV